MLRTDKPSNAAPIVFYVDELATKPAPVNSTWADVVEILTSPAYIEVSPCTVATCKGKECPYKSHSSLPPDEDGPNDMAWSPVQIVGDRADKNVRAITLLVLDFDGLTDEQANLVEQALAGREHILHTTHNHRSDSACFRAVLALSRPVLPNEWHRFLKSAISYLGVTVEATDKKTGKQIPQPDRTCKDRSRLYFRPSHPVDAPHDAVHRPGEVLDVDAILALAPAVTPAPTSTATPIPDESPWDLEGDHVEEAILTMVEAFPERRRHELCMALAGMLRRAGATREDAKFIVREIALQGGSDAPDKRATVIDHTYNLPDDDDAAMTGFTRVVEIIGADVAKAFGDEITAASNEVFLRRAREREAAAKKNGKNGTSTATATSATPTAPAAPLDLAELRSAVRAAATRKMASNDRDDKVAAILLRRAVNGEPLAFSGDVETRREGEADPVGADDAVRQVAGTLAFILPDGTPWDGAREILHESLAKMDSALGRVAERSYVGGQVRRIKLDETREAKAEEQREAIRENMRAQGGTPPPSNDPPDGANWEDLIVKKPDGSIAQIPHNAWILLRNFAPDFRGMFRWNVVSKRIDVRGPMGRYSAIGLDSVVVRVQDHLASVFSLSVPHQELRRRIITIARENPYDPLRDFLLGLTWDGVPRLWHWTKYYLGAIETPENQKFLRLVSERWPVALVARGLQPGCKVDYVLVIGGPPGIGKSTAFSILGGEWFCDSPIKIGDKDSMMLAGQYWICEMAELVSTRRAQNEMLKSFFSSQKDTFRPPYGADIEESPRRSLTVGTVNDETYLGDETGNRKYLTIDCEYTEKGLAELRHDREQILAEAVHVFKAAADCPNCEEHNRCLKHRWHIAYDEIHLTEAEADKRLMETPIKLKIPAWWYALAKHERPQGFTTLQAFEASFEDKGARATKEDLQAVGTVLKKMGFTKQRDSRGKREWRYYPSQELLDADREKIPNYTHVTGRPKPETKLPS